MNTTREMSRPDRTRWLYRTPRGDFGPMATSKLLEAIENRDIDLATPVSKVGSGVWAAAGEEAILRDHYGRCQAIWDEQALYAETERLGRRLERAQTTRKGAWIGLVLGAVGLLGGAAFLWWRLSLAEPIGIAQAIVVAEAPTLPAVGGARGEPAAFSAIQPRAVKVLAEPELLDTAGVRIGDDGGAPVVNRMQFDESGEVQGIASDVLARVTEDARRGLVGCAEQLARTTPSFSGTDVRFAVTSGRLADFSVGREVSGSASFRACVKVALGRVSVPAFAGPPRRVTVPLRIGR